ncbi:MAG: DUF6326 family protein [Pyrinomonadaceae bacterium]
MLMTKALDRRTVLSTLWIFVMFNYLYADLSLSIFIPGMYEKMMAGMSAWVLVVATALMELQIAMILSSRLLPHKINRLANIIVGVIATLFVAVTLSRNSPGFYLLLATIEIVTTLFIIWYAWTWRAPVEDAALEAS